MFDASPDLLQKLYFVRNLEIIELAQLKDRFYEPGLLQKVLGYSKEPLRESRILNDIDLYPSIHLLHPDKNDGKLAIGLKNRGGGYGPVKILINGKEVSEDARGSSFDSTLDSISFSYDLANHPYLKPGELNTIEVSAYNEEEYLVSRPQKIYYIPDGEKEDYTPTLHAILVGSADYSGDELDLSFPSKDAKAFGAALNIAASNLLGTEKTNFKILTTEGDQNSWPTKENIRKAFSEIGAIAKPYDAIVLYFAGHGTNYGGQDGDFYYLTASASNGNLRDPAIRESVAISSNELTEWIKDIPALKQVLIFDACHSGQFAEDLMEKRDLRNSSEIRSLERMKDRTGMYILSGSAADAVSYEASIYGQGLLTYSLLFGMKGASLRDDKFVDVVELFQFAADKVPELAESIGGIQKPEIRMPYGGESFDLGVLEAADRDRIDLPSPKPLFVRSAFQNQMTFDDDLNLTEDLNTALKELQLADGDIIFIDALKFKGAYSIRGQYTSENGQISLRANLLKDGTVERQFDIQGNSKQDLTVELIKSITLD
jgi:hypothetical protein